MLGRLDQLRDLLRLDADLPAVADVAGQPEHQFVEEQHDRVIAEDVFGVLADDGQAFIQRDERVLVVADRARVPLERPGQQVTNEPLALLAPVRFGERRVERGRVPAGFRVLVDSGNWAMNAASPSRSRIRADLLLLRQVRE